MRDPERITRILGQLEHVWRWYPDMRLPQLIDYAYRTETGTTRQDHFYTEDNVIERGLAKLLEAGPPS